MMKKLISILCLLCSPPLFCQEIDKLLYQVEILAYQYPDQGITQHEESWPKHPSVPDVSQATQLSPLVAGNSKNTLELLPRSSMKLNKEQSVLTRQKGVKILFHYAWLQNFEHSETIHIYANPERFPEQYQLPPYSSQETWTVDGTVRLNKGNYFNLSTQLLFKLESQGQYLEFLIQQKRKLRENEVHYIDHPLVGLLVMITPTKAFELSK